MMKHLRPREEQFDQVDHFMNPTENDEAIARAIAESDVHRFARESHRAANCPANHELERFQTCAVQRVTCNRCQRDLREGESVWSCVPCNFDVCEACSNRSMPIRSSMNTSTPTARQRIPPSPHFPSEPSSFNSHMCTIPCTIGNITVEMLVDTGAQTSVLSLPLVARLGLSNRLDRSIAGVAAGVGRARITGTVRNVVCAFGVGHVEFLMDFIVLDVSDDLVIIGLDQLRKYKCLVDMEREKLVFGGAGGVEVPMLPAAQQQFGRRSLNTGCTVM